MLNLVLERSEPAFEKLADQFQNMIRMQVFSFTQGKALSILEDSDSLFNIALMKLWDALRDFRYETTLGKKENEGRFVSMLKTYIKNAMVDRHYYANITKRKAPKGTVSIGEQETQDGQEEFVIDPPDRFPSHEQRLYEHELAERIRCNLINDEIEIFDLLRIGYTPDQIAGTIGIPSSRIRYVINSIIRPYAEEARR